MNKKIILFVIIVIAGLGIAFYYFENPFSSSGEYQNISIYAVDSITNKQVETGYVIKANNAVYDFGNTSKEYIIREKIPLESNIEILSKNINDQDYYTEKIKFFTNSSILESQRGNPKRIKMILEKPGNLNVQKTGLLHVAENPQVYVETETILKDLVVCVDWSFHFFYAELNNLSNTDRIKNKEECYFINETLKNGKKIQFSLDYKEFQQPNSQDYILLEFYDSRYNPQENSEPIKTYKYYY